MTLMGTVRNGMIIPDQSNQLAEGARVQVTLADACAPAGTSDALRKLSASWDEAFPGEFDDLLRQVQDDREQDLQMQLRREHNGEES